MCWDVDIAHRPNSELVDADYWSWLGVDIEFDPLFQEYLEYTRQIRHSNPAPIDLPMHPENMPYYRDPCFQCTHSTESSNADALHIQSLFDGYHHLHWLGSYSPSECPCSYWRLGAVGGSSTVTTTPELGAGIVRSSINALRLGRVLVFEWSFLILDRISRLARLTCDTSEAGPSLFNEFAPKATVFSSGNDLLNHIRASGHQSVISGYLINSYHFQTSKITSSFWKLQLSIIAQLHLIRSLSIVMAIVIPDHDGRAVRSFIKGLESAHWKVSRRAVSYLEIGDSISDS